MYIVLWGGFHSTRHPGGDAPWSAVCCVPQAACLGVSWLPAGVISQITLQSEVASFVAFLESEAAATITMWVFLPLAAVYLAMSGELCWLWKGEVSWL